MRRIVDSLGFVVLLKYVKNKQFMFYPPEGNLHPNFNNLGLICAFKKKKWSCLGLENGWNCDEREQDIIAAGSNESLALASCFAARTFHCF